MFFYCWSIYTVVYLYVLHYASYACTVVMYISLHFYVCAHNVGHMILLNWHGERSRDICWNLELRCHPWDGSGFISTPLSTAAQPKLYWIVRVICFSKVSGRNNLQQEPAPRLRCWADSWPMLGWRKCNFNSKSQDIQVLHSRSSSQQVLFLT